MRAAVRLLMVAALAAGLPACQKKPLTPQQNIAIDSNLAANADIETLPADESDVTPSNQLVNGTDNPDVNDTYNSSH